MVKNKCDVMTKNNDVQPSEKENEIRNSKRIVFVVFACQDLRLLEKLLHFLDHESSWVFLRWDRTTRHSLKMPELNKAKLTFVSPQHHISWGGNGVMMAQEKFCLLANQVSRHGNS